jgi:hypothetical protein
MQLKIRRDLGRFWKHFAVYHHDHAIALSECRLLEFEAVCYHTNCPLRQDLGVEWLSGRVPQRGGYTFQCRTRFLSRSPRVGINAYDSWHEVN